MNIFTSHGTYLLCYPLVYETMCNLLVKLRVPGFFKYLLYIQFVLQNPRQSLKAWRC